MVGFGFDLAFSQVWSLELVQEDFFGSFYCVSVSWELQGHWSYVFLVSSRPVGAPG